MSTTPSSLIGKTTPGPWAPELDWPDRPFEFHDMPGEHEPCYVVMPGGEMIALCHHAINGVDQARAKYIIAACNSFGRLLHDAERIKAMKFDRIRKRNGHETGIESDDGEKCWIVHSDYISALEFAIKEARAALGEVTG